MKGLFITNRYYSDAGMEYIFDRLRKCFSEHGVDLVCQKCPICSQDGLKLDCDFVVFWDKDYACCEYIEKSGIRCFNNSQAIRICDNKKLTYLALCGQDCLIPSYFSPTRYDVNDQDDLPLLDKVKQLGFPLIAKEETGSQGRQVYLINNDQELLSLHKRYKHNGLIYQKFLGDKKGEDIRIYVAGTNIAGICKRTNTTSFTSNVCMGGEVSLYDCPSEIKDKAIQIAKLLNMDFGSVDFIMHKNQPYFVEANSNAYFKGIESVGANIAQAYVDYIISELK